MPRPTARQETHPALFKKLATYLPSGGLLLTTMDASEWEGTEAFFGTNMFWSHFSLGRNREIIEQSGFDIMFRMIDTDADERHQIIMARKR